MSIPRDNPRVERPRRHQKHREAVMRQNQGVCHICHQGGADAIDHIVPVSWGGSDNPRNLAPAHTSCNSAKRDAPPAEWTYGFPEMWIEGHGPNVGLKSSYDLQRLAQWYRSKAMKRAFWAAVLWFIFIVPLFTTWSWGLVLGQLALWSWGAIWLTVSSIKNFKLYRGVQAQL
jgi:hypothetical protein